MRHRSGFSLCVCSLLCLAAGRAAAENTVEVYPLGFSDPSVVEQALGALAGPDGRVILDRPNSRVLFMAPAEQQRQAADLMKRMNAPPRNVRINVRFVGAGSEREAGASLGGGVAVRTGSGGTKTDLRLEPEAHWRATTDTDSTTQTLLVASGRTANLRVGHAVPHIAWFRQYGVRRGYWQSESQVQWQEVGSFLAVEPTVVGDGPSVRIRITPTLSGRVDGKPYEVRFTQVASEVTVDSGQTILLGGLVQDQEFYSKFLIGADSRCTQGRTEILLTPQIEGP
jgi:hypothetical protein